MADDTNQWRPERIELVNCLHSAKEDYSVVLLLFHPARDRRINWISAHNCCQHALPWHPADWTYIGKVDGAKNVLGWDIRLDRSLFHRIPKMVLRQFHCDFSLATGQSSDSIFPA